MTQWLKVTLIVIGWNYMKNNMYSIYDSYGKLVKSGFPTWKAAFQYKICMQRYDWTIK